MLTVSNAYSQIDSTGNFSWKKIKTVDIEGIDKVSIDPYASIYISDVQGNIKRYDSLGNFQLTFSPVKKGDVTLLEGWRYVNTFVYYRNFQQYTILDRFLNQTSNIDIDHNVIGFARLVTFSIDNNIWIVDDEDFSLVKYNTFFNKVDLKTNLDLLLDPETYDLTFMREYQNLLFICDRNSGILIFDNLGNYKSKLPVKSIDYFGFYKDEIYFIKEGNIHLYNIYTSKERILTVPETISYKYALLSDSRTYLFTDKKMEVYEVDTRY